MNIPINVRIHTKVPRGGSGVADEVFLTGHTLGQDENVIFQVAVNREDLRAACAPWATNHQTLPARLLQLEE